MRLNSGSFSPFQIACAGWLATVSVFFCANGWAQDGTSSGEASSSQVNTTTPSSAANDLGTAVGGSVSSDGSAPRDGSISPSNPQTRPRDVPVVQNTSGRGDAARKSVPKSVATKTEPKTPPSVAPASDAGPANTRNDTASNATPEKSAPGYVVRYRDEESPLTFHVSYAGKDARTRAKEATSALENALEHAGKEQVDKTVTVRMESDVAVVRIGSILVTTLYDADAERDGLSLERYAERMEGNLRAFVSEQLKRKAIQLFVLHVFLSVFFGVLGFLTLRFLRTAFDRWDSSLDRRRGSLQAISILRVPVISGEALGGSLAFGLAVGRVSAYVSAVVATFSAILGQFDATRPLLSRLVSWSAGPVLGGVEIVVSSIPGIILAAALFVGVRAGLRVLNLLLDGVSSKQIVWKKLPPARVPVFRIVVSALTIVVSGPLLVSAAFGRFGTPLEWLALGLGGVLLLASVPAMASYTVGAIVLWRDNVRLGDWVQVGVVSGEVTRLSLGELSLVPEGGGTIGIPMFYLLWHPLRRLREPPEVSFNLTVQRDRPAKELIAAVVSVVVEVEPDARAECIAIGLQAMTLRISAPSIRAGVRQQLLIAVSDAVDRQDLKLPFTDAAGSEDLS